MLEFLSNPLMSSLELLATLKADSYLRSIPAVVLTTSDRESEIRRCYAAGAAGYLVKPASFERFVETIRAFRGIGRSRDCRTTPEPGALER